MERLTFHTRSLANNIFNEIIGSENDNFRIIKINSENLNRNGDISFPIDIRTWLGYVTYHVESADASNVQDILEYYLRSKNAYCEQSEQDEIVRKVSELLIIKSQEWSLKIDRCTLERQRMCLFLNKPQTLSLAIKTAIKYGHLYGKKTSSGGYFTLKIQTDQESDLTNQRLYYLREFTKNILRLQGHNVSFERRQFNYILTTRSEGIIEDNHKKIVVGVVKNPKSNSKETSSTWENYLMNSREEILRLNSYKYKIGGNGVENQTENIKYINEAVIKFAMLSIKPSRAIFSKTPGTSDNTIKGAIFILYNVARIRAILQTYTEKKISERYPESSENQVDFSNLNQEQEWNLVYTYVLQYPEMIQDCIKHKPSFEICSQYLCSFLYRLCKEFSTYYRRTRILLGSYQHLLPTIIARIHLLKSLLVVMENSLAALGITPVSNM